MKMPGFCSSIPAALLLVSLFASASLAASGSFIEGDDGSADHPYQIEDAADLKAFAAIVNGGAYGANAKLVNDICLNACGENEKSMLEQIADLGENANVATLKFNQWTPIGGYDDPYTGTFDGDGHIVSGLYVDQGETQMAMFLNTSGATIKDLGVIGYIYGAMQVGGIVGYSSKGTIDGCFFEGSVKLGTAGGLIGFNEGTTISNSYAYTSTTGGSWIGGLVGYNNGGDISKSFINKDFTDLPVAGYGNGGFSMTSAELASTDIFDENDSPWTLGEVVYGENGAVTFKLPYLTKFGAKTQKVVHGKFSIAAKNQAVYNSKDFTADDILSVSLEIEGRSEAYTDKNEESFIFSDDNDLTKSGTIEGSYHGMNFTLNVDPVIVVDGDNAVIFGKSKNTLNIESPIKVDGSISLKRNIVSGENMFSTMMLPFSVKASSLEGKAAFYKLEDVRYENKGWKVLVTQEKDEIKAHTPYLVQIAGASASELTFGAVEGGYTLQPTEDKEIISENRNGWELNGSYRYYKWEEGDAKLGHVYGFAANDGVNDANIVGKFAKIGAGAYIYPMRVYLEYGAATSRPAANGSVRTVASLPDEIEVVIVEDGNVNDSAGETTKLLGTLDTRTGEFKASGADEVRPADRFYDLKGRSLGSKKPQAKGKYIMR